MTNTTGPDVPSFRTKKNLRKPWHARAKRDDLEHSLGYYATREEALEVERQFAIKYPPHPMGQRNRWSET